MCLLHAMIILYEVRLQVPPQSLRGEHKTSALGPDPSGLGLPALEPQSERPQDSGYSQALVRLARQIRKMYLEGHHALSMSHTAASRPHACLILVT